MSVSDKLSDSKPGAFGRLMENRRMVHVLRNGKLYLMMSPFLILFALFTIWPFIQSFYLSFTNYNGIKPPEFIGTQNYERLWQDTRFLKALSNTAIFVVLAVVINTSLGLALAVTFRKQTIVNQICRVLFFLPSVTSSLATLVIWRWIFSGEDSGLGNTIMRAVGLKSVTFLADTNWTMPILVVLTVWGGCGFVMILFLAGLQSISPELHEAAALDGADNVQRFLHLTLPLLKPTLLYVVIIGIINAFQTFDSVYVVFRSVESIGGVLDSGLMIVPYLYDRGFNRFQLGYASSIAWVLFGIIFIVTMFNLYFGRKVQEDL